MRTPLDPKPTSGSLRADGLRFGIVVSRFNSFITDRLLRGALDALEAAGVTKDQLETLRVPGSFEIPLAAKNSLQLDACTPPLRLAAFCAGRLLTTITSARKWRAESNSPRWIRACLAFSAC